MNDLRPGWRSSEFWATLAGLLVSALVMFGVVKPHEHQEVAETVTQCVAAAVALVTAAAPLVTYIKSRTHLKSLEK